MSVIYLVPNYSCQAFLLLLYTPPSPPTPFSSSSLNHWLRTIKCIFNFFLNFTLRPVASTLWSRLRRPETLECGSIAPPTPSDTDTHGERGKEGVQQTAIGLSGPPFWKNQWACWACEWEADLCSDQSSRCDRGSAVRWPDERPRCRPPATWKVPSALRH